MLISARRRQKKLFLCYFLIFHLTLKSVRVKQCFLVCLCFTYWSASAQTPFAFFFVFSDFPHQGWHWVACWIWFKRRKKRKKKKRKRKLKKEAISLINMLQNSEGRGIRNTMLNFHAQYLRI